MYNIHDKYKTMLKSLSRQANDKSIIRSRSRQSNNKPPSKIIDGNLQSVYLKYIKEGKKTVEGRINMGKWKDINIDDVIKFTCSEKDKEESIHCKVKHVNTYSSFREMLDTEGVAKCLPGITNVEEGVKVYRNIDGYEAKEGRYGVIAYRIVYIKDYINTATNIR